MPKDDSSPRKSKRRSYSRDIEKALAAGHSVRITRDDELIFEPRNGHKSPIGNGASPDDINEWADARPM